MQIDWNQIFDILFYIFSGVTFIQIFFYTVIFSRLVFYKNKTVNNIKQGVSVIICARNEAENLKKYLPTVLEQKYPDFEVIVVNDASIDETETVLKSFQHKYKNLYITNIDRDYNYKQGKKLALTVGIKAAKNEILLLTDADCIVDSEFWIEKIVGNFDENTEIVLGYGGYLKQRGLLNKIIRYDTLFVAIQYLSFAILGVPYMGVGRNLAYKKSLFFKNKGFATHLNVASGDDDLFINEVANKKNTRIVVDKQSFTHSNPKRKIKEWFIQKRRHFSTSKYYKFKHKFLLGLEPLSRILFYFLTIILIVKTNWLIIVCSLFLIRMLLFIVNLKIISKKLNEQGLIILGMFFDIFFPILNFLIYFSGLFSTNKKRWK